MTAPLTPGDAGTLINPGALAWIAALTPPDAATLSTETIAEIEAALGRPLAGLMGYTPGPGSLNDVAFRLIGPHAGDVTLPKLALLTKAYAEAGVEAPAGNGKDLSDLMDAFNGVEFGSAMEQNLTAYGIVMAMAQLDMDVAIVLADGRAGAGFMWDEIRANLRSNAGLLPLGDLPFEIPT
jgi:hypothetical protein